MAESSVSHEPTEHTHAVNHLFDRMCTQKEAQLPEPYLGLLQANMKVWEFFGKQAGSYRKAAIWWVMSAKNEVTRRKRIDRLIAFSAKAELIPQFTWKKTGG